MSSSNLCVDLIPREDGNGNVFYVGKLKFDGTINCKDGIAFLIFINESGNEELQITSMDKNNKGKNG